MPKLYVLVGVPGSGKSTWVDSQDWSQDCAYISTDKHVEAYAENTGKTYSQVFQEYMPTAVDLMVEEVVAASLAGKDIIWDQTSTTIASRKKKFSMLPDYYAIAIVFKTPDDEELARRLSARPGKIIPESVVTNMIDGFEMPDLKEGFAQVWFAD